MVVEMFYRCCCIYYKKVTFETFELLNIFSLHFVVALDLKRAEGADI